VFPDAKVDAMLLYVGAEIENPSMWVSTSKFLEDGRMVLESEVKVGRSAAPVPTNFESLWRAKVDLPRLTTTIDSIAQVRRGAASGMNEYFFVTEQLVREFEIEPEALVESIARAADFPNDILDDASFDAVKASGGRVWLFAPSAEVARSPGVAAYLKRGRKLAAHKRALAKLRSPWWSVELPRPADVLVSPIGRGRFRVFLNKKLLLHSNNLVGLTIRQGSVWDAESLAVWLRSQAGQRALSETTVQYAGSARRLSYKAMRDLRLPDSPPRRPSRRVLP
jgi:hypothetical protein